MTVAKPAYKRILLKLSGEALMGDDQFGINRDTIVRMVDEVADCHAPGCRGRGGYRWWEHLSWRRRRFSRNGPCHSGITWVCWPRS
jgi:hypothetical protein